MEDTLNEIYVTEVTNQNIDVLWTQIIKNMKEASFIALDAEMSGLGPKGGIMASNLDDRYTALASAAKTRAIISLGLSCFKNTLSTSTGTTFTDEDQGGACEDIVVMDSENNKIVEYTVNVYNFILLCSEPYTIDSEAVQFLVSHGFNFNKQFSSGIPYHKGNDKKGKDQSQHSMRHFFSELIKQRKPLVLHNGLTDLVFMYQCFYADCPNKLTAFMADISEIFPNGVYDTKYLAEFHEHTSASFLLFLFKYSYLKNVENKKQGKSSLKIHCNEKNEWTTAISLGKSNVEMSNSSLKPVQNVCEQYSAYGWCVAGAKCRKSHNIDLIMKAHNFSSTKSRKRKRQENKTDESDPSAISNSRNLSKSLTSVESCNDNNSTSLKPQTESTGTDNAGHRSGLDAFMTGYAFAVFIVSTCTSADIAKYNTDNRDLLYTKDQFSVEISYLPLEVRKSIMNKLYLSGKSIPLPICKSQYTKTSKNHDEKLVKVHLS